MAGKEKLVPVQVYLPEDDAADLLKVAHGFGMSRRRYIRHIIGIALEAAYQEGRLPDDD